MSEIEDAMIEAGVAELHRVIPMDRAQPVLDDETIVRRILCAALSGIPGIRGVIEPAR